MEERREEEGEEEEGGLGCVSALVLRPTNKQSKQTTKNGDDRQHDVIVRFRGRREIGDPTASLHGYAYPGLCDLVLYGMV